MSDNSKEAEKEMEKAIFVCGDCWLNVFDLLPPRQLGLGIALISRRFDYFVDEHFKTRKWTLDKFHIEGEIGKNGTNEMEIVDSNGKAMPIPQNPLPNKVIGFRGIRITYFDQNVLTFLGRFDRFFSICTTMFGIGTANIRILEFVLLNIWPKFKDTVRVFYVSAVNFGQMRQFVPSMLSDCPSLLHLDFLDGIPPEFPPDDSANASDGQAVAKWLFTPRPDNFPKRLSISIENSAVVVVQWLATVERIKAAFSIASSPVAFTIFFCFPSYLLPVVVPFELINELSGEKLTLAQENAENAQDDEEAEDDEVGFLLIRCPIVPDEKRQQKMIKQLGKRWNRIDILIAKDGVDEGLLDSSPGPRGDH